MVDSNERKFRQQEYNRAPPYQGKRGQNWRSCISSQKMKSNKTNLNEIGEVVNRSSFDEPDVLLRPNFDQEKGSFKIVIALGQSAAKFARRLLPGQERFPKERQFPITFLLYNLFVTVKRLKKRPRAKIQKLLMILRLLC